MNQKNVKKREVLEFKDFLKVINDPWNPKNLSKEDRTGFHTIKIERPWQYMDWVDPIFNHTSKIMYAAPAVTTESGTPPELGGITE